MAACVPSTAKQLRLRRVKTRWAAGTLTRAVARRGGPAERRRILKASNETTAQKLTSGEGELLLGVLGGTLPPNCQNDVDALWLDFGITASAITNAVTDNMWNDANTTSDKEFGLFTETDPDAYDFYSKHPDVSITSVMNGPNSGIRVQTALPGSALAGNIYFNPSYVNSLSTQTIAGLLMHEALHALGPLDPSIEKALGVGEPSDQITQKFTADCFPSGGH